MLRFVRLAYDLPTKRSKVRIFLVEDCDEMTCAQRLSGDLPTKRSKVGICLVEDCDEKTPLRKH